MWGIWISTARKSFREVLIEAVLVERPIQVNRAALEHPEDLTHRIRPLEAKIPEIPRVFDAVVNHNSGRAGGDAHLHRGQYERKDAPRPSGPGRDLCG